MTADQGFMWVHNFEVPLDKFKNDDDLFEVYTAMLVQAGFQVFDHLRKQFEPAGVTILWGLCESHLACHSFPESNKASFQLASCNYEKYRNFLDLNVAKFGC